MGETVPTMEVTDDDHVDWGSGHSHGDKGTGQRNMEKGWTWTSIQCVMREREVTGRAASFLVGAQIGLLQVIETQLKVQVSLEQHRCELCGSTCTHVYLHVFSVHRQLALHICGLCIYGFNQLWTETLFSVDSWESAGVEGQVCSLFSTILYKGLQHHGFGNPWRVLEPIPGGYEGTI